jgi:hypothetical protein
MCRALSVLFTPVGGAERSFEPEAVKSVFQSLLADRNAQRDAQLEKQKESRLFAVVASEVADQMKKRYAES